MSGLAKRTNVRTFLEQRMANNLPSYSYARQNPYSNFQQLVHGVALHLQDMGAEVERTIHNRIYHTLDSDILDVLYTVPAQYGMEIESITGYVDSTTPVLLTAATATSLRSFWREPLPTRLEYVGSSFKQLAPTHSAKDLAFGSEYEQYQLGTHIESHLADSTSTSNWTVATGTDITYSYQGGWGNGYYNFLGLDNINTEFSGKVQATSLLSNKTVGVTFQYRSTQNINELDLEIGYDSIGSTSETLSVSSQWNRAFLSYFPNNTASDTAFFNISFTGTSTEGVNISDLHFFNLDEIYYGTNAYNLRSWVNSEPSDVYVIVSSAQNLLDVDPSESRPSAPTMVTVEMLDERGMYIEERIPIIYNGTHKLSRKALEIIGTRVDHIYPNTAQVSVQLQNYQSEGIPDYGNTLATPEIESMLFHQIQSTNGTSHLQYQSFVTEEIDIITSGYDSLITYANVELLSTSTSSYTIDDFCHKEFDQHIYTLSTASTSISIYDQLIPWPEQSQLAYTKKRTLFPDMVIDHLDTTEIYNVIGGNVYCNAHWRNRDKKLIRNRWTLIKPDGTKVGLTLAGAEVSSSSNYWIINEEEKDNITADWRFVPQSINYSPTDYGSYVLELEAEYFDVEANTITRESDFVLFSNFSKIPYASFTYTPQISGTEPIGIDLDSDGNILLGYSEGSKLGNYGLRNEKYRFRYDYYLYDSSTGLIYLREPYTKIVLKGVDVNSSVARHVIYVTGDVQLTVQDINNGFIVVLSDSGAINVTLPDVGEDDDALHGIIKRWGANVVNILPGTGVDIDEVSSYSLSNDKDAYDLTYLHDLLNWGVH